MSLAVCQKHPAVQKWCKSSRVCGEHNTNCIVLNFRFVSLLWHKEVNSKMLLRKNLGQPLKRCQTLCMSEFRDARVAKERRIRGNALSERNYRHSNKDQSGTKLQFRGNIIWCCQRCTTQLRTISQTSIFKLIKDLVANSPKKTLTKNVTKTLTKIFWSNISIAQATWFYCI